MKRENRGTKTQGEFNLAVIEQVHRNEPAKWVLGDSHSDMGYWQFYLPGYWSIWKISLHLKKVLDWYKTFDDNVKLLKIRPFLIIKTHLLTSLPLLCMAPPPRPAPQVNKRRLQDHSRIWNTNLCFYLYIISTARLDAYRPVNSCSCVALPYY